MNSILTSLSPCPQGTSIYAGFGARNVTIYREKILNDALLPWIRKQFGRNHWTFQQDLAPSHKPRETQRFFYKKKFSASFLHNNIPLT